MAYNTKSAEKRDLVVISLFGAPLEPVRKA